MAGRKVTFDESIALKLYHERKTDGQIEKALGKKPGTIASWRKRRNLPSISVDPRKSGDIKCTYQNHVSYKDALSPKQAEKMGRFLSLLLWAGEKAVDVGVKPDVECFLKAWRGIPISEDGKKEQRRMEQRVYEARRRAKKVKISV